MEDSKKTNYKHYINKELEEKGYCIIPNVLTTEEIEESVSLFRKWKQELSEATGGISDIHHEKLDPHGIYKNHQVGHQRFAWFIRTRPQVINVFKHVWNIPDDVNDGLVVSFDGANYIPKDCNKKDKCWTHTDQAPCSIGIQCYQAYVALTDNKERTFRVYEGSHKLHEKYYSGQTLTPEESKKNWNIISDDYLETIQDRKRILDVKAGSMVLWDSRCFHQGQYGAVNSEERIVQYVCMLPSFHPANTKAMQKKRLKYFETRRTTTHWPCPIHVNPEQPRTFGDDSFLIDYSVLPKIDLSGLDSDIRKLL